MRRYYPKIITYSYIEFNYFGGNVVMLMVGKFGGHNDVVLATAGNQVLVVRKERGGHTLTV